TALQVEVETRDPDWDYVNCSYRWTVTAAGEEEAVEGADGPTLSHEYFERGDTVTVEIVPNDGSSDGAPCLLSTRIANAVPEITSTPPEPFPSEGIYTYQVEAEDADGDDITFSLDKGAPPGVSIDAESGLLTWRIDPTLAGAHTISIRADDGYEAACSQGFSVTLPGQ
ncbi:MAG: putative Ig domain-containing protein, partial [Deltaproteobacteria bacterium]|nr:putative Ig domain-containing protein [Candidatus Zymogenaceae bacterium]